MLDGTVMTPPLPEKGRRKLTHTHTVNVRKAIDDAKRLKQHAARVFVLDAEGNIIQEIRRNPRESAVVRLIAVLAPALMHGVLIHEALVLEVGFSRVRPYASIEELIRGDRCRLLTLRRRVRKLTSVEYYGLRKRMLETMRDVVLELREAWKHKEPWRIGRRQVEFERGIFFTIDKSDVPVYAHMLAEDLRFRKVRYFANMRKRIRRMLMPYAGKRYSDKQFMNLKGVNHLAYLLAVKQKESPLYVREILSGLNPLMKSVLGRVVDLYQISFSEENAETRLVDAYAKGYRGVVPDIFLCRRRRRKRPVQGKNRIVLEVFLDKRYREQHEVPF